MADEPRTITYKLDSYSMDFSSGGSQTAVFTLISAEPAPTLEYDNAKFIQTEELTEIGIAVHPYGAIIVPIYYNGEVASGVTGDEKIIVEKNGVQYASTAGAIAESDLGDEITFTEVTEGGGDGGDA